MEARPCPICEFFNGTKQMMIPLFQRPYEWSKERWETLWEDLLEQYENAEQINVGTHFTGAIVTAPARSVPVGVSKYLVIDGQQRLTTYALILCALRSLVERDSPRYRKLTRLLLNEDDQGLDRYKLLPTQPDRSAFEAVLERNVLSGSRFSEATSYFIDRLTGTDTDGQPIDLERMIETLEHKLTVVAIHLGDADDPYLIFESLNAKGAPLTQADLIRNYLLLRLRSSEQEKAYNEHWLPMQTLFNSETLSEFMRQYLMLAGEEVLKSSVYSALKRRLAATRDSDVLATLSHMTQVSADYSRIVGLNMHPDEGIQRQLDRLRQWEVATANPLILTFLRLLSEGIVGAKEVVSCLKVIESYVIRRGICRVPTNQLKKIFLALTKDAPKGAAGATVLIWLEARLAALEAGARWPKDDEFKREFGRYIAYSQPLPRCRLILSSFEEQHGHKEKVDMTTATIEHVMPVSLTQSWRTELGADSEHVHERYVNSFGNLTLTAYNSELSNHTFAEKRRLLSESNFVLNRSIASASKWGEEQIVERAQHLLELAITIWPRASASA